MTEVSHYLVDTGVFILYLRRNHRAIDFLRSTEAVIYYSRVTRKELLRPPISGREHTAVLAILQRYRIVNPDPQIADGFAALLEKYPYLHDHLADALIAATAWKKNLEVVTTNPRHFTPNCGNPRPALSRRLKNEATGVRNRSCGHDLIPFVYNAYSW